VPEELADYFGQSKSEDGTSRGTARRDYRHSTENHMRAPHPCILLLYLCMLLLTTTYALTHYYYYLRSYSLLRTLLLAITYTLTHFYVHSYSLLRTLLLTMYLYKDEEHASNLLIVSMSTSISISRTMRRRGARWVS
jgi:hypothetical protein